MKVKLLAAILIFILALAARVTYLEQIKSDVLFENPVVDSGDYHSSGMRIAGWTVAGDDEYEYRRVPFYENLLGLLYKWGIPHIYFACFVQCIIGAFSACLVYILGLVIFNRKTGILAGLVASLYWPFIVFSAKTLPVNLAIFFSLLTLLSLYLFLDGKKRYWGYASGVFLALSCLTRPNFLLIFPVAFIGIVLYFTRTKGRERGVLCSLSFLLAFFIILAAAGSLDFAGRKEIVPIQKNYAVTAYMGMDVELLDEMRPGSSWKKRMRELLTQGLISRGERDVYWLSEISERIKKAPAQYARSFLEKLYLLLNNHEVAPYENLNYFRDKSGFLRLPLPSFGWIVPFAILGMFFSIKQTRGKALPLFIFSLVYFIALLPFPPLARYRLPLVPFMIIFAAYCVMDIVADIRLGQWKRVSWCAVFLAPLFIFTYANPMKPQLDSINRPYYYEGRAYLLTGNTDKALEMLEIAVSARPDDADIYEALGDVYNKMDKLDLAEANYEKSLEIEPDFPEALEKLGVIYAKRGDLDRAIRTFHRVISAFPTENASTHINLAACYSEMGDNENARKELERALYLDPGNFQAFYKLTILYEETGHPNAPAFRARLDKTIKSASERR